MDLTTVRRRLEERERLLSPYAARSADSRGRGGPEGASPPRTGVQRGRGRSPPPVGPPFGAAAAPPGGGARGPGDVAGGPNRERGPGGGGGPGPPPGPPAVR